MSKIAQYLQEHLVGEVMTSSDVRDFFSTDGSIFRVVPQFVVYPRNEQDVRKTARFAWQLAERGHNMPITARGFGSDLTGAAIGPGIILATTAHLNKILTLDNAKGISVVQSGIGIGKLQQTLFTHGHYLPVYPSSLEYTTVGGAVAGNSVGAASLKYGMFGKYVRRLRAVLANGEIIEVSKLSKRELSKKMGQTNFEGELYRSLHALLHDQAETVTKSALAVDMHTTGYNLKDTITGDGGMNLLPLILGSQGTLAIVTEVELSSEPYNPTRTLVVAYLQDGVKLSEATKILKTNGACSIEFINKYALEFVNRANPNQLKGLLPDEIPGYVVLAEFDEAERAQKRQIKKTQKQLKELTEDVIVLKEVDDIDKYWKLRHASATILANGSGQQKALPLLNDAVVSVEKFTELLKGAEDMMLRFGQYMPMWGSAGTGMLSMQPMLDITQVGDRQKAFRMIEEMGDLVVGLGGAISAQSGDGRLRGAYLAKQFAPEVLDLFQKVKQLFDPYSILNPGVKIGITADTVRPLIAQNYKPGHWFDHMPRL